MLQVLRTVDRTYTDERERVCILGLSVEQADELWVNMEIAWRHGTLPVVLDPVFRKLAAIMHHGISDTRLRAVGEGVLEGIEP